MRRPVIFVALLASCLVSAQTVRLQIKFPPGRTDRLTTQTKMNFSVAMPGSTQKMEMQMLQSMSMISRVLDSGPQGASVRVTYEKMASSMSMAGKPMGQPSSDLEKSIKGRSVTILFAPNGKIKDVKGMDSLMAKSQAGLNPQVQAALKQMFSKQSLIDSMSMAFGVYPARPLRVGEGWNANMSFGQAPFRMGLKLRMKLQGVETRHGRRTARIGVGGTGSLDLSGMGAPGMKAKTDRFTVSGISYFDLDRGWTGDSTMKISMHLVMSIPVQGKTQSTTMSMNLTSENTVTPIK